MQSLSQNIADNKTATDASEDATIPQQAQTEKIEALLESVNSASQHVRNYYITFLLAGFYIAMIIWSTTDLMLLKNTPVKMPLLDVELPIIGFYTFSSYFFLLLHFNLLLQFSLLSDKVHRFNRATMELKDADSRRYYYTRLFAFAFTQTLGGQNHSPLLRFLLTLMVWISAIWLPLGILIGLQVGFLAYHSEEILSWQRMAIMLDLLVLFVFWPIIRSPDGNGLGWILKASGIPFTYFWIISWLPIALPKASKIITVLTQNNLTKNSGNPLFEGGLSLATLIGVATFSWTIAVLPDSRQEQTVRDWLAENASFDWKSTCPSRETGQYYFRLTEHLFDGTHESGWQCFLGRPKDSIFKRNLIIREQLLIANELKAEDEADLISEDETVHQAALKKVTGLILSDRDLRYADFSGSRLPKVDFVGSDDKPSDLSYANFSNTMLIKAYMNDTKLQRASLKNAQLQGVKLWRAQLQGADLEDAQLQRAYLVGARLQRANLRNAELQGEKLWSAQLQGANLEGAKLRGADLNGAQLQKANLKGAQLQGINLILADLQGTFLEDAQLQGASLVGAQLQGALLLGAQLQGANLEDAQLQGAILREANLSYSDITRANFGLLTQQELKEQQEALAGSIYDDQLLKSINDTLIRSTQKQTTIFQVTAKDMWDDDSSRLSEYGFSDALEIAKDQSAYPNKLAAYLLDLSCSDRWTAAGIIRNRMHSSLFLFHGKLGLLANSFAQCLLSLQDQKNKAGQLVCPAMSEIDKDTVAILEEVATGKNSNRLIQFLESITTEKNSNRFIQPTFTCQTKLSDQNQTSE